jgi:hypothetical protein
VSADTWYRVTFTIFAIRLSFFEAVALDSLIRGSGRQAIILADVEGVLARLSEQGAQRVGKDYEVEPVAVTSGVFHPKVSVFSECESSGKPTAIPTGVVLYKTRVARTSRNTSSSPRLHPQVLLGGGSVRFKRNAFCSTPTGYPDPACQARTQRIIATTRMPLSGAPKAKLSP